MKNYSSTGTTIMGFIFILCGMWAIILTSNLASRNILHRIKLSAKAKTIISYLLGVLMIIWGIIMVKFGLTVKAIP